MHTALRTIKPTLHRQIASLPCLHLFGAAALIVAILAPIAAARADDFTKPTKEELEMTSLPGYPGAPAVVLFREQITKDDLHVVYHYDRIKVLTEEGKKYANVELGFASTQSDSWEWSGDDKSLGQIIGRTIHPDGTIIPFTGKPYLKTIDKMSNDYGTVKFQSMVFTLPDVEVGSIIEYRYNTRISDHTYEAPEWYIQGELYVKSAHFAWYPTTQNLIDYKERPVNAISWFPILPVGAKIEMHEIPGGGPNNTNQRTYDLVIKDVPPILHEEHMPPMASYSYRVLFNFTWAHSADDYWKSSGKDWSKRVNSFANPNSDLTSDTQAIIAGANTQDEKLRKIYAAVEQIENTDYTREHDRREDKANGLAKLNKADDVLKNKRGDSEEITELFAGMARAAGMKADLMLVPDRSKQFFTPIWLNFSQFDATIAIVNVDGKDVFLDPGSRYCSYGHLAWQHTFVDGLRQKDGETVFDKTSGDGYSSNKVIRVANLNMDDKGTITGKIDLAFVGSPAVRWRQRALRGDDESLKHQLRTSIEDMIPKTLEVKDIQIQALDQYEQPLKVTYIVGGTLGSWTGKRLVLPADLFLAGSRATFPDEKRQLAVYFDYPDMTQDALRINFPSQFTIEAAPSDAKFNMPKIGVYAMSVTSTPTNFTTRRDFAFGDFFVLPAEYPQLRSFYSQFETNDQESIVLKTSTTVASSSTPAAN
jgi:hypothetical protein